MKININGITRDMSPEEEAQWRQEMANMPQPEPTPEDRLTILENALLELGAMLGGAM